MKNGLALKGHKRVLLPLSEPQPRWLRPSVGYRATCICGWDGGNHSNYTLAKKAYRQHLDFQINHCLFRCRRCGEEKPRLQMRLDYRYICLACSSKMGNEWQRRNPEAAARHKRNHHLLKKFGITLEESETLLAEQDGLCAICQETITDSRGYSPHIDHDHITGKIRGILCFNCNVGLGAFEDNPGRLIAAAQYLIQHSKENANDHSRFKPDTAVGLFDI